MFGFAAMASGTLRELISIGLRFFSLTTLHASILLSEGQADCEIAIDASHLPDDVRRFFMERDIAAIVATVPWLRPSRAGSSRPPRSASSSPSTRSTCGRCSTLSRSATWSSTVTRTVVRVPRGMLDEPLPRPIRTRWPSASRNASRSSSGVSADTGLRRECDPNSCLAGGDAGSRRRRRVAAHASAHAAPPAGRRGYFVSRAHQRCARDVGHSSFCLRSG